MTQGGRPYVVAAGESRRDDARLPFKACAADTNGVLSMSEFVLCGWESGPPLHMHDAVDEALYVLSGVLAVQLGEQRAGVSAGGFVWMPRGVAHGFANAGPEPAKVLALAVPGGIEDMFAEHAAYLASVGGPPDPRVMDEIAARHGSPTVGAPIRADGAPG